MFPYDAVYGHGIEDMLHRIPSTEKIKARDRLAAQPGSRAGPTDVIDHTRHAPVAVEAETLS